MSKGSNYVLPQSCIVAYNPAAAGAVFALEPAAFEQVADGVLHGALGAVQALGEFAHQPIEALELPAFGITLIHQAEQIARFLQARRDQFQDRLVKAVRAAVPIRGRRVGRSLFRRLRSLLQVH